SLVLARRIVDPRPPGGGGSLRVLDRREDPFSHLRDFHQITPRARKSSTASGVRPRSSRRIASVCWPSVGGAERTEAGVSDSFTGTPSRRRAPIVRCSTP